MFRSLKSTNNNAFDLDNLSFSCTAGLIKVAGHFCNGTSKMWAIERDNNRTPTSFHKELAYVMPSI